MQSARVLLASLAAIGLAVAMPLPSEQMPRINGESLLGKQVSRPFASRGPTRYFALGSVMLPNHS